MSYTVNCMSKKLIKDKQITVKINETLQNVRGITRHIRNVQDNCMLLGEKLIELGDIELGKNLIANGFCHDNSKFYGIEYEFMAPLFAKNQSVDADTKKMKLKMAISHHSQTNLHHPEAWPSGISSMPDVFLAEFCCDVKSRSEEFGTSLIDWINNVATKKWNFSENDVVYKKILKFVNLLCEMPFTQVN